MILSGGGADPSVASMKAAKGPGREYFIYTIDRKISWTLITVPILPQHRPDNMTFSLSLK